MDVDILSLYAASKSLEKSIQRRGGHCTSSLSGELTTHIEAPPLYTPYVIYHPIHHPRETPTNPYLLNCLSLHKMQIVGSNRMYMHKTSWQRPKTSRSKSVVEMVDTEVKMDGRGKEKDDGPDVGDSCVLM
jgi:hypothetical protein